MTDRRRAGPSPGRPSWPALAVGALLAGILAMGFGRAAGSLFPRDSEAALLVHILVALALAVAGGAGLAFGSGGAIRDRWRTIRRK